MNGSIVPNPNYTIEGLTHETHGPYCRDAIRQLLKACPAISGVTFRIHGESGVTEGSYDFWKTVFDGVATCGRKVEIDMHAKGMNQTMIDVALATGMPVNISPKYWAEHLGMPYHQADIRAYEIPKPGTDATGFMKFSAGSRSFIRYGYGDLFKEDRRYGVLHRVWPGTQRLLLWGDPVMSAAHSQGVQFLRQCRSRTDGTALVQRPSRIRHCGRSLRISGFIFKAPMGLGKISLQSSEYLADWRTILRPSRMYGAVIWANSSVPEQRPLNWLLQTPRAYFRSC